MRYVRFFVNYSKIPHSTKTKKIIKQNINGISNISSERLLDEFKKITISRGFLKLFKDPFSEEVVKLIFPQFKNFNYFKKLNNLARKKINEVDHILLILMFLQLSQDL